MADLGAGTGKLTENRQRLGLADLRWNRTSMGSSFHWADSKLAVKEFHRILVPGGFFTAIWNPRDIESKKDRISAVFKDFIQLQVLTPALYDCKERIVK